MRLSLHITGITALKVHGLFWLKIDRNLLSWNVNSTKYHSRWFSSLKNVKKSIKNQSLQLRRISWPALWFYSYLIRPRLYSSTIKHLDRWRYLIKERYLLSLYYAILLSHKIKLLNCNHRNSLLCLLSFFSQKVKTADQ